MSAPAALAEGVAAFAAVIREAAAGVGGSERSVKLKPGAVIDDRLLLSFPVSAFGRRGLARLAARLAMPGSFAGEMERLLAEADIVHFGYEAGEGARFHKLYLEFAEAFRLQHEAARRRRHPLLVHHAFKWDPERPARRAVTRYWAPPLAGGSEIAVHLSDGGFGAPGQFAAAMLARALRHAAGDDLLVMDVEEPGSGRRSFDLNLYPAGLVVADAVAALGAFPVFAGPEAAARLAADAEAALGHVAGGIGRDGAPFVTLYFGARELP